MTDSPPFDIGRMAEQVLKLVDDLSQKHPMQARQAGAGRAYEDMSLQLADVTKDRNEWKRRAEDAESRIDEAKRLKEAAKRSYDEVMGPEYGKYRNEDVWEDARRITTLEDRNRELEQSLSIIARVLREAGK